MIEPPPALFLKQMEVVFRYAVITAQMPLWLAPAILNPVDVMFLFGKFFGLIEPKMAARRVAKQNSETTIIS